MLSNGDKYSLSPVQRRSEAIDRLLAGRSEAVKTNVLSYIAKYAIDPETEFFIIFVALGELETLIEKSPKEWQKVFTRFQGELKEWGNGNLEILKHLSHKAELTEKLATNSEKLSESLIKFLGICETLISQLQKSSGLQTDYLNQLQASQTESTRSMEEILRGMGLIDNQLKQLNQRLEKPQASTSQKIKMDWNFNTLVLGVMSILLIAMGYFQLSQSRVVQHTNQKVQWLLEKANRRDCLSGIKKPNSPECKSLK